MTDCEKCGKDLDEHPMIDVSNVKVLQMCDRHPKWVRVEPGHIIPAGQPTRVEWFTEGEERKPMGDEIAREFTLDKDSAVKEWFQGYHYKGMFVDSSWRPPLVLPTEPTWGIAVVNSHHQEGPRIIGRFAAEERSHGRYLRWASNRSVDVTAVLDFIPLTEEQVQRIEDAR